MSFAPAKFPPRLLRNPEGNNYVGILGRLSQGANMLARRILVLLAATTALAAGGTQGEAVPTGPGRITFVSTRDGSAQVYVMNADGSHVTQLTRPPGEYHAPVFSPDGRSIAFVYQPEGGGSVQICVMNANGSHVRQLTRWPQPGQRIAMNANMFPHFSLDGRTIVFTSMRSGTEQIHLMNPDGSGVVRLTNPPGENFGPTFGR